MKASPPPHKKSAVSSTNPSIRQQKLANANNSSAWLPPSTRPEAEAVKKNIQELQDLLATEKTWSQEQKDEVEMHIRTAREYLDTCKAAAVHEIPLLKDIRAKLETKYVKAYAAVSEVISRNTFVRDAQHSCIVNCQNCAMLLRCCKRIIPPRGGNSEEPMRRSIYAQW